MRLSFCYCEAVKVREIELCMKYSCKICPANKTCMAEQKRREKQRDNDIKKKRKEKWQYNGK